MTDLLEGCTMQARKGETTAADFVLAEARKWMAVEDEALVTVPLAVVIANRLPGPPVWLMIVAPPSSGKSEILLAVGALNDSFELSQLTAKTFMSGLSDSPEVAKNSLLPYLSEQKKRLLVLKDFGTIMSLPYEARSAIQGQLREIYDGKIVAASGTGKRESWSGKLGLLAAATPAIDRNYKFGDDLGERFLALRPVPPSEDEVMERAVAFAEQEKERRASLAAAAACAMHEADAMVSAITTATLPKAVGQLALLVSHARTPVRRDRFDNYEVAEPEGPGRLIGALGQLYRGGLAIFGGDEPRSLQQVIRVGVDSVPARRGAILRYLSLHPDGLSSELATSVLKVDKSTARRELEDLALLKLLDKTTPANVAVYVVAQTLLDRALRVLPSAVSPQAALQKLFPGGHPKSPTCGHPKLPQ